MEMKSYSMSFKIVIMMILASAAIIYGAADPAFEQSMKDGNSVIWDYVVPFLKYGLFGYTLYLLYGAFFSQDKQTSWFRIFAVIAFIAVLQFWPTIYATLTGSANPINNK